MLWPRHPDRQRQLGLADSGQVSQLEELYYSGRLSLQHPHDALDGDFGQYLSQKLLDTCNIINLGYADVGFRNITNSKKEIKIPEDLKGLKIRTMTNPLHVEYFTALGAIPTPMSFSELFTALQQKTVDGQENPTALIYNNGIYEVQKYMTITEHVWTSCPMCIAADFFNGLPSDYQELIKEAAAATISYQRELITQQNADLASKIEEAGVKVTTLTDDEKAAFKKVAEDSVYKTAAKDYGQDLIDMWNRPPQSLRGPWPCPGSGPFWRPPDFGPPRRGSVPAPSPPPWFPVHPASRNRWCDYWQNRPAGCLNSQTHPGFPVLRTLNTCTGLGVSWILAC